MITNVLDYATKEITHRLECDISLIRDYTDDWYSGYVPNEIVTFFGEGEYLTLSDLSEGYHYKLSKLKRLPKGPKPEKKPRVFRGYYYDKTRDRWLVYVKNPDYVTKMKYYGSAKTEEEAKKLREEAKHLDRASTNERQPWGSWGKITPSTKTPKKEKTL